MPLKLAFAGTSTQLAYVDTHRARWERKR